MSFRTLVFVCLLFWLTEDDKSEVPAKNSKVAEQEDEVVLITEFCPQISDVVLQHTTIRHLIT